MLLLMKTNDYHHGPVSYRIDWYICSPFRRETFRLSPNQLSHAALNIHPIAGETCRSKSRFGMEQPNCCPRLASQRLLARRRNAVHAFDPLVRSANVQMQAVLDRRAHASCCDVTKFANTWILPLPRSRVRLEGGKPLEDSKRLCLPAFYHVWVAFLAGRPHS